MKYSYLVMIILIGLVVGASSSGRNEGRTQAPGDSGTCQSCHGSAAGDGSVTLTGFPNDPLSGETYSLTLTVTDPGQVEGGFQIVATNSLNNTQVGTFTPGAGSRLTTGSQSGRLTHSSPKAFAGDGTSWTFDWTAPISGAPDDAIQFYYVGNAVNGNNSTGGDFVYFGNTASIVLPVKWAYVRSAAVRGGIEISWATHQEINSDRFEIERSIDGSNFEYVGEIEGRGYFAELSTYSYIDENAPEVGSMYYRIKQIDLDGKYAYSDKVVQRINNAKGFSVYPNPTADVITVSSDIESDIIVFDAYKRVIANLNSVTKPSVDLSTYPSGIYYLMNEAGQFQRIVKR